MSDEWDKAVKYQAIIKRIKGERDEAKARIDKALELTGCDHDSRHDDVCQICAIRAALTDERQGDE